MNIGLLQIGIFFLGLVVGSLGTLFAGLMYQFYKIYNNDKPDKNDN